VQVATGESLQRSLADPQDGGQSWYFVELYDHMCPHCWYAVPIVTNVASAFQGVQQWNLASLNCHVGTNAEVCFFLELISGAMDYPTFVLCPPGNHQEAAVDMLPPRARALLDRLSGKQRETFMRLTRCRIRYVENSPKGKEDPFLSAPVVARWVTEATGLRVAYAGELNDGADFTDFQTPDPGAPPGRPGWLRDDKPGAPGVPAWVPGQRWFDSLRGLVVLLHLNYRAERHDDIVDSMLFLARTFPVKGDALEGLAMHLKHLGPQDDPKAFQKLLSSWADKTGLPDPGDSANDESNLRYMTCDGSTCVMWTLLHVTITAAAVRGVSGRPLMGDGSILGTADLDDFPSVNQCMDFVKIFVRAFLDCGPCKKNFIEDYNACEFNRCNVKDNDWRGLALWLWRAHNAISMRVAMRHHAEVDRRWPMYEDCPACWRRDLVMEGSFSHRRLRWNWNREELDAPYHTDHVFWHLVRTFVGLTRVQLEVEDLSEAERQQVEAVREDDRRVEAHAAKRRKPEHRDFVKHPPAPYIPQGSVHAARAQMAAEAAAESRRAGALGAFAALLLLFGAFGAFVVLRGAGDGPSGGGWRAGRTPVLRQPPAQTPDEDEDEDLVADSNRTKGDEEPHDMDPAAE